MCRAIWAIAIAPDEAACGKIRRAAGADVQVVAMATTLARVEELMSDSAIDVAVIDAATPDAYGIVRTLRRSYPKVAVVWVGDSPPDTAHVQIRQAEPDTDHLSSAVTRALISRRA